MGSLFKKKTAIKLWKKVVKLSKTQTRLYLINEETVVTQTSTFRKEKVCKIRFRKSFMSPN